ncbi:MAG: ABC-F family ATP-binding cassette domain-containing protein [Pseudolabrys sp.]|nr:ABC-F family ATP-binding cassette domain-containing protein [Pseudolabrys sp.]MCW5685078.1 ABC-F family ATP-binding cassette domain-containing protein [Pseudolabrys sp.]
MLIIDDLSIRIAGRLLLDHASVRITPGSRIGLVGRNGAGKSTLFNAITGEQPTETGHITLAPRWRIGRLAQEAPDGPESLIDVVLRGDTERTALLAEAETATDPQRIADIQTRLADIGAYAAPARAAAILSGLGFSAENQQRPCSEFSGGWRMRVALAAVLFSEPDLLLLDEPTNYLDLEGTLWLQDHLAKYPKTMIVISHDRDLLDSSVDFILSLEHAKLTLWRGGYSAFEAARAERLLLDQKLAKKQDEKRKHMQAFVDRFRAKATKARQAQSRLKMLEKMETITVAVTSDVRPITFPKPDKLLSPPIIALDGVSVGYEPGRPVLSRLTLRVDPDDRIGLLGSNGNGKSTLVKLIADKLEPFGGSITRAQKLKIAYFAQHQLDELNENASAYDHVRALMPDAPEAAVRTRVGTIGFSGEAADTKVAKLSGGEKARLMLALATFDAPHLLILDEPTNHLDIDSRAALIEAIADYPGATILVSHDRHLLDACADRLLLVADGAVRPFDGDLDDYRRRVLSERNDDGKSAKNDKQKDPRLTPEDARKLAAQKRENAKDLRQRVARAQTAIDKQTQAIAKLDEALADGTLFARDPGKAATFAKERAAAADALATAEEEWLAASEAYETAMA